MRQSTVLARHDSDGDYEIEVFDHDSPKRAIVCSHGNGVRRWDGERFFYEVAEHYADSVVVLVDQNQPDGDGAKLNSLPTLAGRVSEAVTEAKKRYPNTEIVLMGHSMGCGVACFVDLEYVNSIVLVAPAVGNPQNSLIERYGPDIVHGKTVTTSDGLRKTITAQYYKSVEGIVWEDEYRKLIGRFNPVYAFEAGDDEIVGDGRFAHRDIPFTKYEIIPGAKHNFAGPYLKAFFAKLDPIL